jgi:peptide/nickel transport system permease protein
MAVAVFLLPHVMPGHPLQFYETWPGDLQQRARLISDYGFDRALPLQGVRWLQRLATGQWGTSRYSHRAVFNECWRALLITSLLLCWTLLACYLGIVGLWCLRRLAPWLLALIPRAPLLRLLEALPSFLVAVLVRELIIWRLGWVSITSLPLFETYYFLYPSYMLLPASILAFIPLRLWCTQSRKDTPQAFTLRQSWRHMRTALHPHLELFLLELILTEYVFSFPGLGSLGIEALKRRDIPLVQGFVVCIGFLYIVLCCLCDRHRLSRTSEPPTLAPAAASHRMATYHGFWCLLSLGLLTLCVPWLLRYDPLDIHSRDQCLAPGYRYALGTDFLGRDVLSRTIQGFRNSLPRVLILTLLSGGVVWAALWGLRKYVRQASFLWRGGHLAFCALPSFILAFMIFLVCEHRPRALELTLMLACLPVAARSFTPQATWLQRVTQLTQLGGLVLMLEVTFYFLNLNTDSFAPTWGSDLRHGMHYGHINIWMVLAPTWAVVWSRYSLSQLQYGVASQAPPVPLQVFTAPETASHVNGGPGKSISRQESSHR